MEDVEMNLLLSLWELMQNLVKPRYI